VQTSKRQCKRYQCVSRESGKEFDMSLMRDGMRRKATSSCCRALLLCSNRDRATFSSDARPGLAPIQSRPPLVYSVYSRRRQQFSADARLARDAHREKFRGLLDFDIRRKKNETGLQILCSGLVLVFDFRISSVSVVQTKHGAGRNWECWQSAGGKVEIGGRFCLIQEPSRQNATLPTAEKGSAAHLPRRWRAQS